MKKLLSIILCVSLLFCLIGCNKKITETDFFGENTQAAIKVVTEKYRTKAFGEFDLFEMTENLQSYGKTSGMSVKADLKNDYFSETIEGNYYQSGTAIYYKKDGKFLLAKNVSEYGGPYEKTYSYSSESDVAESKQTIAATPYRAFANFLNDFSALSSDNFTVESSDATISGGNISIKVKGVAKDVGNLNGEIELVFKTENYLITYVRASMKYDGVDVVDELFFNQKPFERVYPDLSEYRLVGDDPNAPDTSASTSTEPTIVTPVEPAERITSDSEFLVDPDNNRTYYQLLVYSFADSNGDGIGDFKGIADHLDYLVDLGIEGIWLSPIQKASSYHSYDVLDYYAINPSYIVKIGGVEYGVDYLLRECHKRGIKVLMDLVLNHTSYDHVWRTRDNHYDWYGNDDRFGFPEFNFDKREVRTAIKEVGEYWLRQGFDGFRLDAAMWIYNSGSDRHQKNYAFWQEWCSAMKAVKPDCYIIGEVLDDDHDLAYNYANAGFDSTFDFNALGNVINAVGNGSFDYASKTATDIKKATDINANYVLARALSNHDIGRFNQAHPDSNDQAFYVERESAIKLANAINALTPGNTFVYYGDELGLKGTCEDTSPGWYYDMNYRTAMPWSSGTTDPVKYFAGFHGSGKTTSVTYSGKTADVDAKNEFSIYTALKYALYLKNSSETLQKGIVSKITGLDAAFGGFDVTYKGETIRVVYRTQSGRGSYDFGGTVLYSLGATVNGTKATMPAYSLIAIKL